LYPSHERSDSRNHEWLTHVGIAMRLAVLKGVDFANEYDSSRRYPGPVYFVPEDTLDIATANALGIRSARDLFGGVVPHPFVGHKAITHPLVEPGAHAPVGWSHDLARRVHEIVHSGFSAFTREDAYRAGVRLLDHGLARIKPVRATGGLGQIVVTNAAALAAALAEIDASELAAYGLVLEENLSEVMTYSVGRVHVADLLATYCGTQRLTPDNSGTAVYGGSDLTIVQGDFEALLTLDLSETERLAVMQARAYDAAVMECFPELIASRRNYDIAQGLDPAGRWRSGVLEQSWRIGGASTAEIAALEAFRAEPTLHAARAFSVEIYGESDAPPAHAAVYFRGVDERAGPMTKYAAVERHGNAR
jgi:Protein of unknown function (DUF3182)